MKLSIIIPVYNEERLLEEVIRKVKSVTLPCNITKEMIIIDDCSTDNTVKILKKYTFDPEIKIIRQNVNMGKSAAVRLGIEKSSGDIILIQDADLEYDPNDYIRLIEPIIKHNYSVVYGTRFKGWIKRMHPINRIANLISNITLRLLFRTKISDINTCYKVFKKIILKDIKITSKHFTFETEITAKLLNKGYKIYEVPINYFARTRKEGKKITWLKALQMYFGIIKFRFIKDNCIQKKILP